MTTKKMFHVFMMTLGAIALLTSAGCRTKGGYVGATIEEGTWVSGADDPMSGDFSSLPRVQGVNFAPVYFAYDNYQIPASENYKIDSVVSFLQGNNNVVLIVEGHCDERGTIEYNLSLGEYRAQSIRSYMSRAGISSSRIQTTSYGKERPAVSGNNETAWSKNRRGEFALYRTR